MSINGLFQTGRNSIRALEAAMQAAGHNVANAGTPGYHRRTLDLRPLGVASAGLMIRPPHGTFAGVGAAVVGFGRTRDALLEGAAWQAQAGLGAAEENVRLGAALEAVLDPEAQGSVNGTLEAFWNAWGDAANTPADPGVRRALLGQAGAVTAAFRRLDGDLTRLNEEHVQNLDGAVGEANTLLAQIAALNERAAAARTAGTPDLDAEDARDAAVRSLSTLVPVRVAEEADGSYAVTVQGMAAVQGREVLELERVGPPEDPAYAVRFKGTTVTLRAGDGSDTGRLGAALSGLTVALPQAREALDALAARLVSDVNGLHETGFGLDGGTGRPFFDPARTSAAELAVAVADPAHVALAGAADAPGDAAVARALADLGEGFTEEALGLSTTAGRALARARTEADARGGVVAHLDALAAGVSGVSIDEEMTSLIQYQQAYAASARVLETAQALFDTLLAL
jgi:flagellar hook-associated protein 1 FlgK